MSAQQGLTVPPEGNLKRPPETGAPSLRDIYTRYSDTVTNPKGYTMNPLSLIKLAADVVVSAGAGAVVGNAIKATTPITTKTAQRVCITVGGFVLSSMVGNAASKFALEQIDAGAQQLQELKDTLKKKD